MLPVLIKAVATAGVVVLASALTEMVGPFWGALIASLPISAGPAYLLLALTHDAAFVAGSALASAVNNAATMAFLLTYAAAARRRRYTTRPDATLAPSTLAPSTLENPAPGVPGAPVTATARSIPTVAALADLAMALGVWLAVSLLLHLVRWTATGAVLVNLLAYALGLRVARRLMPAALHLPPAGPRRWWELPMRAAVTAGFVTAVVTLSGLLGPGVTGVAAVFPMALSSILLFVRPRIGPAAACVLALTTLRTMLGFGLAVLTIHLTVEPWGLAAGLLAALGVSMLWPIGLSLEPMLRSAPGRA